MLHNEFRDAGYRVFGLLGANDHDGSPLHEKLAYKKPWSRGWQHTPDWSDEQWEAFHEMGMFDTGYGVLMHGLLVVDIDARNGGIASYEKLLAKIPQISGAGLIVETGSGGGSKHLYFRSPKVALLQSLKDYPGIDFKSSGYVVGPGSLHASGARYTALVGSPDDIDDAPVALVALLEKPEHHRHEYNGTVIDVSQSDIADMLGHIGGYDDYESWIEVGMCVHHATGGTGFDLWDAWSQKSTKYDADEMHKKWHSFGKSPNPKTIGTLIYLAEQGGWQQSVTFTPDVEFAIDDLARDHEVDLLRPPGFVGEVAAWIESQSRRPRERLAVAAALTAIGNVIGLRYRDERDNATSNLFTFCIAGSRTGKESIQQAMAEIHRIAGIGPATHGSIKSEQEIMRNIAIRHQAAFYIIDEFGELLRKIRNSQQRGGASYLEGTIALLMSAYSKANGRMLVTGDLKDEVRKMLLTEYAHLDKAIKENESQDAARLDQIKTQLEALDDGLVRPFLSLIGFTTPITFDSLIDFHIATNGFVGRSLLFDEKETAPRSKPDFRARAMSQDMAFRIAALATGGTSDARRGRVEEITPRVSVRTDSAASKALDEALTWFEDRADDHKALTGLESLYLGAYELLAKVSFILAAPTGVRTVEHVRWAFALVKRDIEHKVHLVTSNDRAKDSPQMALMSAIAHQLGDEGQTLGVLLNRLVRKYKKDDVQQCLAAMVEKGTIIEEQVAIGRGGRSTTRYKMA